MKILINKNAGVCWGVERAIDITYETVNHHPHEKIVSLGPLVHNPEVVEDFKERGVEVIGDLSQSDGKIVVFRSHGVPIELYEEAKQRGLEVVDATCPFVKRSQNYARHFSKRGYTIVIVGDKNHPEMKSVQSFVEGSYLITMDPQEVTEIPVDRKVGVIAQTTIPLSALEAVIEACRKRFSEVKVHDTICDATKVRQEEAAELAAKVDGMIIIGGKNSSNTIKLTKICRDIQPKSYQIEHENEIDFSWFEGIQVLGITAGASTPIPVIERVSKYIHNHFIQSPLSKVIY